jgi:hypothetical protein
LAVAIEVPHEALDEHLPLGSLEDEPIQGPFRDGLGRGLGRLLLKQSKVAFAGTAIAAIVPSPGSPIGCDGDPGSHGVPHGVRHVRTVATAGFAAPRKQKGQGQWEKRGLHDGRPRPTTAAFPDTEIHAIASEETPEIPAVPSNATGLNAAGSLDRPQGTVGG